jgi:radical SAM superfamily enzyme YgiQ (UPF0313 family)
MFYDDEININTSKFESLLEALIKYQVDNNVQFAFRGFTRSTLLNVRQADLMKKAGFKWLLIGFESGSNQMLRSMNKNTTVEQNTNALTVARLSGLKVKALMSIGHPGESLDTIAETKDWLYRVKPDETDITIITPYPGSPYFDEAIYNPERKLWIYTNQKMKLYSDDVDFSKNSYFYKGKSGQYVSFIQTDYLTKEQLLSEREKLSRI